MTVANRLEWHLHALLLLFILESPLFYSSSTHTAYAQDNAVVFERISAAEGLSSNIITSITQDGQGFLWIGTQGGLNRYDGNQIRIFRPEQGNERSLSDEFVRAVAEFPAGSGTVWAGTYTGGLNAYDPLTDTFTRYRHDPTDGASLGSDRVEALLADHAGRLWIGTFGGGLHLYNPEQKSFSYFRHNPQNNNSLIHDEIRALHMSPSSPNSLWIGTSGGLSLLNVKTMEFTNYNHIPGGTGTLSHNVVTAIATSSVSPNTVWVGTQDGLHRLSVKENIFNRYTQKHTGLTSDHITALQASSVKPGRLWIGSRFGGLADFDPVKETTDVYIRSNTDPGSLSNNDIRTLFQDHTEALWIGTWNGLHKIRHKRFIPPNRRHALYQEQVFDIFTSPSSPDMVWVATLNGGLHRLDRKTDQYTRYFRESDHPLYNVIAVYEDADGLLWLGFPGDRIYTYDPETSQLNEIPIDSREEAGAIFGLHASVTEENILWIATSTSGLYKFDMHRKVVVSHYEHDPFDTASISHNELWDIHEDRDGIYWIGTGGGLNRFDSKSETFTVYRHHPDSPESISSNRIVTIAEDAEGYLWLGTPDKGLNRFDTDSGTATRYFQSDGLPHKDVGGIVIDTTGILWLITSNGFSRFDPEEERFINFDVRDGLQDNGFHYGTQHMNIRGDIFIGGPNGINIFHPTDVPINTHIPNVVITDVLVDGQTYALERDVSGFKPIELDYNRNDLTFTFAVLDYTDPTKNRHKVMLTNADDSWIDLGNQRSIRYPLLPSGAYTFRVIGSNNDGYWNEAGAAIDIIITPPFWETWWFWSLAICCSLGFIIGAYQYRIHQLKRLEHTRKRIADDLHDDIGSKMSSIALMLDAAGYQMSHQDAGRVSEISSTARSVVEDLRDAVWMVDAGFDDLGALFARMKETTAQLLPDITYRFHTPDRMPDLPLTMEQRRHLFLIYKEILHNAARHARAKHVDIRLSYQDRIFDLEVADDGIGFDPDTVIQGRGMATLQMRSKHLGGTLCIKSTPPGGVTVHFSMRMA